MAAPLGWFAPEIANKGQFDPLLLEDGWFDPRWVDTEGAPPANIGFPFESLVFSLLVLFGGCRWLV